MIFRNMGSELSIVRCPERLEQYSHESGFTLIELLTTMSLIGILAAISIQSFQVYRQSAAYGVAESAMRHGRTALEAAIVQPDIELPEVDMVEQQIGGEMTDAEARALMPGFVLPKNLKLIVFNDPACIDSSCIASFLQVEPCLGTKHVSWTRMGDGDELLVGDIPGVDCG